MKWIVTGASGLIGKPLVEAIAEGGDSVVALARRASACFTSKDKPVEAIDADLEKVTPEIKGNDEVGVFMLAARITGSRDPKELPGLLALDTYGHLRLLDSLGGRVRKVIYSSSCTVYGYIVSGSSRESDPLRPLNPYAVAKIATENALEELCRVRNISCTTLRIAQVYGPGAPEAGALYEFLRAAAEGRPVVVRSRSDVFRDYVHVDDVVTALIAAKTSSAPYMAFNVGSGVRTTIVDLARACLHAAGRTDEPSIMANEAGGSMFLDIGQADMLLDWKPRIAIVPGLSRERRRLHP